MAKQSSLVVVGRILELVEDIDEGRKLTLSGICERFGIGYHAAREYIQVVGQFRDLVSHREGRTKCWVAQSRPEPGVNLVHRAAALEFAVATLGDLEGTAPYEELRSLAEEHRNRLNEEQRGRLVRLSRTFRPIRHDRPENPTARRQWVATFLEALERKLPCEMRYSTLDGADKWYDIRPWGLLLYRGRLLFAAGKMDKGRIVRRFFHFEGIRSLEIAGDEPFPEPGSDQLAFDKTLEESFGIYCLEDEQAQRVHLRVRGTPAEALRHRRVHLSQHLVKGEGEWSDLHLRLKICPELKSFVAGMMPDVVVVEPPVLRDWLEDAVRKWVLENRS